MQAKKSFGQHFLNRPDIAESIAQSLIHVQDTPRVLEVGPGQGMLTNFLIKRQLTEPFELVAVEADKDMVSLLNKNYPLSERSPLDSINTEKKGVNVLFEDFMKTDLTKVFNGESFCLIGNFPYNISSQILFKMVDNRTLIPEMVGMFQKEVADRVVSKPGGKVYGIISVLIQAFYEGKTIIDVDKSCFTPPPKVQSSVIRLVRKENQNLGCDEKLFKQIVKQAFSQRRKMLRNTLKPFFINDPSVLTDDFYMRRPETLSLEEYIALTQLIEKQRTTNTDS
jgi:16S rRNA (adenine1518-N6/adenine1519-N6)-dimethyltransferase